MEEKKEELENFEKNEASADKASVTEPEEAEETQEKPSADEAAKGQDLEGAEECAKNAEKDAPKKDKKDLKIEELNDRYIRAMAEFDNYRKRTDKEKSAMYEIGAKDVIEKILPVVDNFERGLKAMTEEEKTTPVADGMDRIYKQLMQVFEALDVKQIEAVGKEFNPDFHNAVMHVEDENFGENEICEEFQKGYTYRDSVVRHSMVKVAN